MNIISKSAGFLTAGMFALAGVANAQLQTYSTQTAYRGSVTTFLSGEAGDALTQTFSGVSAVKSMTYNFFSGTESSGISAETSLAAVFGEWNGSGLVEGTTVSFGTIVIPASNSGSWGTMTNGQIVGGQPVTFSSYAYTFDLASMVSAYTHSTFGYLTNASKTYALMLTNVTGGETNLGLGVTNNGSAFAFGQAYDGTDYYRDWVFSQIIVAPGNQTLVPIPESSTVATVGSVMLVAFLVNSRMRQRRAVPPAVAA